MERIAALIHQLADLQQNGANPDQLLGLANELQVLLQQMVMSNTMPENSRRIAMILPGDQAHAPTIPVSTHFPSLQIEPEPEEKVFEMLEVDEGEIEAELEEIRKKAEFTQKIQAKQALLKPGILFDFGDEDDTQIMPTLVHHKKTEANPSPKAEPLPSPELEPTPSQKKSEIHHEDEKADYSVNDRLKEENKDVVQFLEAAPIKDLRKAIGIKIGRAHV